MDGSMEDLAGTRISRRLTGTRAPPRPFESRIFALIPDLHFAGIEFCALLSSFPEQFPGPEYRKSPQISIGRELLETRFHSPSPVLLLVLGVSAMLASYLPARRFRESCGSASSEVEAKEEIVQFSLLWSLLDYTQP